MARYLIVFSAVFIGILLWRTVFVRRAQREAIRLGVKEIAIAGGIALVTSGALFFFLFNHSLKIL